MACSPAPAPCTAQSVDAFPGVRRWRSSAADGDLTNDDASVRFSPMCRP
jgi:hypothetical protein